MLNLFAQVVYLAAEGEEPPEGIDLVIPEINELIAGIVAFAIVFLAIWLWARPAISRALAARQDAITGQLQQAEKTKVEAESLLEDYRKQLAEARAEANRIVDEARSTAETMRSEIVARAESEAAEITRRAREEAVAEKGRAEAQIRDEVASLSLALAQKVVAESVDANAQRALVDRYIDDLGSLS
jgi:F-type H+-transporting ATPase subunit b